VRGKPHQQRLGRRGLRKLAGPGWPGHCGPASGREHAQAAVKCARAEARRSAAEGHRSRRPWQRSHEAGATNPCPALSAPRVPSKYVIDYLIARQAGTFFLSASPAGLTKSKQASHGADLPRIGFLRSFDELFLANPPNQVLARRLDGSATWRWTGRPSSSWSSWAGLFSWRRVRLVVTPIAKLLRDLLVRPPTC
jgi:hypothetical protein